MAVISHLFSKFEIGIKNTEVFIRTLEILMEKGVREDNGDVDGAFAGETRGYVKYILED